MMGEALAEAKMPFRSAAAFRNRYWLMERPG